MQKRIINKRIQNTPLYVFSQDSKTSLYTYARPITKEEAQAVASAVNSRVKSEYPNASYFNRLKVAKGGVLYNLGTFKGVLANQELMRQSQGTTWIPTIGEGYLLHRARLLDREEFMHFGIAVLSFDNSDPKVTRALITQARKKGYELPLFLSFKSLDLQINEDVVGSTPLLASTEGLLSGEKAERFLNKFRVKPKSGSVKVGSSWGGEWNASCGDHFHYDNESNKMRFITTTGSMNEVLALVKKNLSIKRAELEAKILEVDTRELKTTRSVESIFQ